MYTVSYIVYLSLFLNLFYVEKNGCFGLMFCVVGPEFGLGLVLAYQVFFKV